MATASLEKLKAGNVKGGALNFGSLAHLFPTTTLVNADGHLQIGGCDIVDLASKFGTPLYVFCEEMLRLRCQEFVSAFQLAYQNTEVLYASKAYVNPALARIFLHEGLGLDVVSGGELALAQAVRFPPERIYFHGNNKAPQELEQALEYRIGRIVVDNMHELDLLERIARRRHIQQSILLRVTPGVDPHTHMHTTTGVVDSKFGLPVATGQAEEAVRKALSSPSLRLRGLHFHLGSPIFELEPYAVATRVALEFAAQLRGMGFQMEEFSPGGGFAIPYLREQRAPSPAEYAATIVNTLRESCQRLNLALPKLIIEPGRAIVGPAGVALYTVGSVKTIPGVRTYVAVDGGMGDNIRPALYQAQYEAIAASKMAAEATEKVTIVGKYCESGDILAKDVFLPSMAEGDLIAMPAAGAYAPSMASTYNLNPRPAIVLVKHGEARLIRRRETYEDLLYCDIY